jgi:hypothetical protein
MTMAMKLSFLPALAFAALVAACGSGGAVPGSVVGKEAMAKQANIRTTCDAAERGHDDPFTVEWEATDVASFEAQAQRDTVFVRYHGCDLQVLASCNDARVPGQLGAYGAPVFTSGAERQMAIENADQLYAELPLAVAKLGARVSAGESFRMRYFVAGVANDTRSAVYRDELSAFPGCAGATHFVAAYNLGAFTIETSEKRGASASAEVGGTGAGAGGATSHAESDLGAGGVIASCATGAKADCRVPIRLHLRPIADGAPPAPPAAPPAVAGAGAPAAGSFEDYGAWAARFQQVMGEAQKKLAAGDAKACLAALDVDLDMKAREASTNVNFASMAMTYDGEMEELKGRCQALGGDCASAIATVEDGMRLMARGQAMQMPGANLVEDTEKQIAAGGAKQLLGGRCAH